MGRVCTQQPVADTAPAVMSMSVGVLLDAGHDSMPAACSFEACEYSLWCIVCYAQCVYLQIHIMILPAATAAARVAAALCVQVMNSRSLPEGIDGDRACMICLNFECNWCSIN